MGDIVSSKGKTLQTIRGIGPIKPLETASYIFSYVWFTDLVEIAKIKSIKIQYMDGTYRTVVSPSSVIMPNSLYNLVKDDEKL